MDRKGYLSSKITVPRVLHQLLPRRGISAIINGATLDEAVCFAAPYGYGKTLAVVSWLREYNHNAAWITLDSSDNSETLFLAGLSAAMMRLTGWQGDSNDILSDSEYIESPQNFLWETVLSAEKCPDNNILVIDNFQLISDPALLRVIKNIITDLFGRWRIIILSRIEFPPVFTELILKGHVCLITPKELSFSIEEMDEFFSMNGCVPTQRDILRVGSETEGWPASLNVVLTLSRGGPVVYSEATRTYLMVFFETEIWEYLREDTKVFLLKTSIMNRLTPAACRAVTGLGETVTILRWLFVNGLFISRLDERDTYSYHRVFQDFLTGKLDSSGIAKRELYRKLAWWLFDNNETAQSFQCFFKAKDMYGISHVLKTIDIAEMGIENFFEMTDCIMSLDIKNLRPYPVIVARMALIEHLKGNIEEMQALYQTYEEWNDFGALMFSSEDYAEYLWESGWLNYLNPDIEVLGNKKHEEWSNYGEYVPHLEEIHRARGAVLRFPSILKGFRDYCPAVNTIESFLKYAEETGDSPIHQEATLWEAYLLLAEYFYEIEKFQQSEEIVRRIMTLAENRQLTDLYFVCTALLINLLRATNATKEIDSLLERMETLIISQKRYYMLPNFHALQLRNRLAEGKNGFTAVFEEENNGNSEKQYFYLLYRHITLVKGLISLGNYNEALLILGNLDILCRKYKRTMDLMELNILKAISLYGLGREDSACDRLEEALTEAKKYGFIRIFSDCAKDIWSVLELARKRMTGKYIQSVVISCKKSLTYAGYKFPQKKPTYAEPTKTERGILKALQSGMSYAEIAQDHDVRISTVKSQLHSIYSKLGVNNRTAAVIAAQKVGILP